MPKWKAQDRTVCIRGTVVCGQAEDDAECGIIVDAHNADIDAMTAERDELKRRLDAVVMEHIRTAELKCYCEFDRDHERTMECEYCEEVATLRAIAEGREV